MINSGWLNAPIRIPQGWSDASLVLIRKPGKSGNEPGHHRPIGLQDQVGKLVFRHVLEPYVPHIHHQSCTFPQYGYLPGRSTIHALRRVFEHCAKVREACRGQGHSVLKRFHGQEPSPLTGGVQVTVDLAGAFDSIRRQQLLRGMQELGLPDRVVEVVMEWHCGARYCVEHDGKPRLIKVTQGVRQGCVIAPLLWLVYSHLISTELASLIGEAAIKSLVNIYADDYHASLTFDSIHGLEVGLSHIGTVLGRLGLTISHSKSKAMLTCRGKGAESLKRRFIKNTKSGRVLRFHHAQEAIDIPLVDNFVYLGAVVSYGSFEDQALEHRLQIGRANFWRLHKILRSRHSLNRGNRLRIWRACVHTASVYGLTALWPHLQRGSQTNAGNPETDQISGGRSCLHDLPLP